jgi:hypothetical protein
MKIDQLALVQIAILGGVLAAGSVRASQVSTPPIASHWSNTFLACALQNASDRSGTARVQIVRIPAGDVLRDTGDQTVAPGGGLAAGAVAIAGGGPPSCTNGDCPCPNDQPGDNCPQFVGAAYCRFIMKEGKSQYRAVGCVSSPASDPVSSPSCVEAR